MKKGIITMMFMFAVAIITAQTNTADNKSKEVFTAPDGTVSMVVYDNANEAKMKVYAADEFYKYEVLDVKTSEAIVASDNKGKNCLVDKTKLKAGAYKIRLYTKQFIITSNVKVLASKKLIDSFTNETSLAHNEQD